MPKRKTKENPKEQLEDFKRLAREIGADADDKGADEVMRQLAKQKRRDARKGR